MTNQRHIAIRRHQFPQMLNHNRFMREWARQYAADGVVETAYWDTHLAIYRHLNEGPIHALYRYYLPLDSTLPRWDR